MKFILTENYCNWDEHYNSLTHKIKYWKICYYKFLQCDWPKRSWWKSSSAFVPYATIYYCGSELPDQSHGFGLGVGRWFSCCSIVYQVFWMTLWLFAILPIVGPSALECCHWHVERGPTTEAEHLTACQWLKKCHIAARCHNSGCGQSKWYRSSNTNIFASMLLRWHWASFIAGQHLALKNTTGWMNIQ